MSNDKKFKPGDKVFYNEDSYEFGYHSVVPGSCVLYTHVDSRNMQDSIACKLVNVTIKSSTIITVYTVKHLPTNTYIKLSGGKTMFYPTKIGAIRARNYAVRYYESCKHKWPEHLLRASPIECYEILEHKIDMDNYSEVIE